MEEQFKTPIFCIVGRRPVRSEREPGSGNLVIFAYNWDSGDFFPTMEYFDRLYLGNDYEVKFLDKQEFERYVMALETERLRKQDSKEGSV